jgi:BirA family transcriptional regulator, biotin operon repressor / biotin---[acetyl-CoA-carboxylase] ligase
MPGEPANRFADIRRYATIDSTNRYLLECAAAGEPEGVVAVADEQTAGRGRLDRSWVAPPGAALLVSVLLRPRLPADRLHLVTLAAALAAIDAVTALAMVDARLKWPNDVVIGDRKLAGILAESDGAGATVVGMGLNVRGDWFPPELEATATACDVDRDELLSAWLRAFDLRLDSLDGVLRDARANSATLGRRVRVELTHESFEGVARDLTPEGYLVVDGRVVTAGDVVHLRPA